MASLSSFASYADFEKKIEESVDYYCLGELKDCRGGNFIARLGKSKS